MTDPRAVILETVNLENCLRYDNVMGSQFTAGPKAKTFVTSYEVSWMNSVYCYGGEPIEAGINEVLQPFKEKAVPCTWFVGALTPNAKELRQALLDHGLPANGVHVGMWLEPIELPLSPALANFAICRVENEQMIKDWHVPFGVSFEAEAHIVEYYEAYMRKHLGNNDQEVWFAGYLDGKPICSISYFIGSEAITIYSVTTLPEHRRQGYAKRMMETAITHALSRVTLPLGLYASPMGVPVYSGLGFKQIYDYEKFLWQPSPAV